MPRETDRLSLLAVGLIRGHLDRVNWPTHLYAMSVLKPFALATALVVGMSTVAIAAARQHRNAPSASTYGAQYPAASPMTSGGGYSTDPHTRYLEELADKHRGGW